MTQDPQDGSLHLRPVIPDDEHSSDGDSELSWKYVLIGAVTIFGEKSGYQCAQVYRATRGDAGEQLTVEFSFKNAGLFQATGRKGVVYYDAKIFYDIYSLKSVSDVSIESMWKQHKHQYECSDSPLPADDKNHFYKAFHEFVRSLVSHAIFLFSLKPILN